MGKTGRLTEANREIFEGYRVPVHLTRIRRTMKFLDGEKPGRLLDIGCADGSFCEMAQRMGWTTFGIDISRTNVIEAGRRGARGLISNFGGAFPFQSSRFQAVIAMEVIEHIIDTRRFLSECRRILSRGGCLILSTPNLARLENRVRLLFGLYPHWMEYELEGGAGHIRAYTIGVLKRQLATVGFKTEAVTGTAIMVPLLGRLPFAADERSTVSRALARIWPSLAQNIVVKARTF